MLSYWVPAVSLGVQIPLPGGFTGIVVGYHKGKVYELETGQGDNLHITEDMLRELVNMVEQLS